VSEAKRHLDRVQSRAAISDLASDPAEYARRVADELPALSTPPALAELEARDHALLQSLANVEELAQRIMRIELDHALANDSSIPTPTRKVFASTIVGYADNLALLEERARDTASRGRAGDPHSVARAVVDAATRTLALRDTLLEPVLALVRDLAKASIADAYKRATDRTLDDTWRKKWSAARRELEALAADPTHIAQGPWPARLAAYPEQIDEPPPEKEVTFADMIELD
jgi:hypothetical protein